MFFDVLKHWAYTDTSNTDNSDGSKCRLADTEDMIQIAENVSGQDLDSFFEVFFRQASFPYLLAERSINTLTLAWHTEGEVNLDLDVPVRFNDSTHLVNMSSGTGEIVIPEGTGFSIDPDQWILMDEPQITQSIEDQTGNNLVNKFHIENIYPNPFNPNTTVEFYIDKPGKVKIQIYSLDGKNVMTLKNSFLNIGKHYETINMSNRPSGIYLLSIIKGNEKITKKIVLLK